MENNLIFCNRCCLDGSASEILLAKDGVCNFCYSAQQALKEIREDKKNLTKFIRRIKKDGKGKEYDCLIGLSGGVDSSMVLHHAVELGLRPLCFSVDNGWNRGHESDENIMKLVETLKVPFYRYVIDFPRFNALYGALIKGGVKNLEAATDHILFATTYEMANRYGIKWIISGGNVATESIMPQSFGEEDARDLYWLKSVYRIVTGRELSGLPVISLLQEQYYRLIKQKKFLRLLDYFDYDREKSIKKLEKLYGYKPYGEKHCESTLTWWYQNFYLYQKYGIDKRKAHFASLINSRQMTRENASELLAYPPVYPELGFESRILNYPKKNYKEYPNSAWIRKIVAKLYRFIPTKCKS